MRGVSSFLLEPLGLMINGEGRFNEDPVRLSNGEPSRQVVVHDKIPCGRVRLALEQREHADAVLAFTLPQLGADDLGASCR